MTALPEGGDRYLGIDLGTSAIKLAVIDSAGRTLGQGQAGFPSFTDQPGQVEQVVADWWAALGRAATAARASCGAEWALIRAIGLAGQLPTLVCLGVEGAWPQAIVWADSRADHWAETRIDAATRAMLYQRTGMPIDGRYLAPMLRFHHGQSTQQPTGILSAKDWLCWALTGERVTDPSTAAGYGVFDLVSGTWADDLCAFWNLNPALLPPVRAANAIAGRLTTKAAALFGLSTDVAVLVGAADS
ncbi:MAG TPA: FGGY family carbohydrate kinase, partial [Acidisoma sp.]|nr:FGGY family carbohydrate kinase [Acidisoma sp.]